VIGLIPIIPKGIILHSTRSGQQYDEIEEYDGTVGYVRRGADGHGWHVTIGPDRVAMHMTPREWGWNARWHSSEYLAIEFSQSNLGWEISDRQLRAAAWWIKNYVVPIWPRAVATNYVFHSELAAGIADGKTDAYPRSSGAGVPFKAQLRHLVGV
jgi:hypothetical protein